MKMTVRVWFGLTAFLYVMILTSCGTVTAPDGQPLISLDEVHFNTSFEKIRLEEAIRIWKETSGEIKDPFLAGKAAYDIAAVTHDPKWAHEVVRQLSDARKALPNFAPATAYQGSAYSLIARNFPLQGLQMLVPGLGFVRIWYVKRAEDLLNKAVAQNPDDPIVRLLRAATISAMPQILVNGAVAKTDFELLARWEANPKLNPEYKYILNSHKWRRRFTIAYAKYLSENEREDEAEIYRAKLSALADREE